MKARRTPWWWYVIAMLVGLLAGMGISHLEETRGWDWPASRTSPAR